MGHNCWVTCWGLICLHRRSTSPEYLFFSPVLFLENLPYPTVPHILLWVLGAQFLSCASNKGTAAGFPFFGEALFQCYDFLPDCEWVQITWWAGPGLGRSLTLAAQCGALTLPPFPESSRVFPQEFIISSEFKSIAGHVHIWDMKFLRKIEATHYRTISSARTVSSPPWHWFWARFSEWDKFKSTDLCVAPVCIQGLSGVQPSIISEY